jgi:hypothetical protein
VVSTDLGAPGSGSARCTGAGDDAVLLTSGCPDIDGNFLIDEDGDPDRVTNFSGALADNLGCMIRLGTDGCGFEQPLEAARRALSDQPANAGFLRDDALLAVVLLTDEDDCSTSDATMFTGAPDDPVGSELGPLSSFRCFDFGVRCRESGRDPGPRTDCQPRDDSPYLFPVGGYVSFLRGLKPDPSDVLVAAIAGDPEPVEVTLTDLDKDGTDDEPLLADSCESDTGSAVPAIRIRGLLDGFAARSTFGSICAEPLTGPLADAARGIARTATRSPCLVGALEDTDPDAPGVQPDCTVVTKSPSGDRTPIPACVDGAPSDQCYTIDTDADRCGDTDTQLAVDLSRATIPSQDHVIVTCRAP